jgi:hypothetical protein
MGEPVIAAARDLVGRGDHGGVGTAASAPAPVEAPQATRAPTGRLGGALPGLPGAVAGLQRAPAPPVAAGDLVARGQAQPRPARLLVRPRPQVQAALSTPRVPRAGVQTRDRDQRHPGRLRPPAARLIRGGMRAGRGGWVLAVAWRHVVVPHRHEGLNWPCDGRLARAPQGGLDVVAGQRWRQGQDRGRPSMPGQRLGALGGPGGIARLPTWGPVDGVARTGHERTADRPPGRAGARGQHVGPRPVHRLHSRLPGLARRRALVQPRGPRAPGGPPGTPLGGRATRATQEAAGLSGLKPRARLPGSLAPRPLLPLARLHAVPLNAPRLQTRVDGTPVHAGRFPRHRRHPAGGPPVGQRGEVRSPGAEGPHRLSIAGRGHTPPALFTATSAPSRVGMHLGVAIGTGGLGAASAPGKAAGASGRCHGQTRSGHLVGTCSTGASPTPRDATTPHRRPDQHQSRPRAVLYTRVCTVFAGLDPRQDDTPRHPRGCPHAYRAAVWSSRHDFLALAHFW